MTLLCCVTGKLGDPSPLQTRSARKKKAVAQGSNTSLSFVTPKKSATPSKPATGQKVNMRKPTPGKKVKPEPESEEEDVEMDSDDLDSDDASDFEDHDSDDSNVDLFNFYWIIYLII